MIVLIINTIDKKVIFMDKITIIGGDNRQKQVALIMANNGVKVTTYGLKVPKHKNIINYSFLSEDLFDSEVIMLPIPYKNNKGGINIIDLQQHIEPRTIFQLIKPGTIVIYGVKDQEIMDLSKQYSIQSYDIVQEEYFSILNAIPTAEGAIQRAMERTLVTLHGSKILVLGYGRIGRVLSRMLWGIGAKVTVAARRKEDLVWIEEKGYSGIHINEIDSILCEQDIIFNTIPALILNRSKLEKVEKNCIIIDLASRPGGVDFKAAEELGLSASLDLGLPGLVAPKTAAEIICRVTYDILKRHR